MRAVGAFKKVALMVVGTAMQTYGEKLTDEQEVAQLRRRHPHRHLRRRERRAARARGVSVASTRRPSCTRRPRASSSTTRRSASRRRPKSALAAMAEGDTLRTLLAALRRMLKASAGQHGRAAPGARRRDGRARRVYS